MKLNDTEFYPTARSGIRPHALDTSMTHKRALCELTDNAFDADAKLVQHIIERGRYTCKDDGHGCDEIDRLISIGGTSEHDGTKAGMFGIGGKSATIRLTNAGEVHYTTCCGGMVARATADWRRMIEENHCRITERSYDKTDDPNGTTIVCEPCRKGWKIGELVEELGFEYAEALRGGRRILIRFEGKSHEVTPCERPILAHEQPIAFEFPGTEDGDLLTVRGTVGFVQEWRDKKGHPGWHVQFAHRAGIHSTRPAGLRGQSGLRIYGELVLPQGWKNINLTKDGIGNDDEGFWEIVSEQSREVIDLARKAKTQFDVNHLGNEISDIISAAMTGVKEKRNRPDPPEEPGTKTPTNSGRKREKFAKTQPDEKAGKTPEGPKAPFTFEFDEIPTPYWVSLGRGSAHLVFSSLTPIQSELLKVDPAVLIPHAATVLCVNIAHQRKQEEFGFEPNDAWEAMYQRVLKNIRMEDSRPLLKVVS